MNDSMVRCPKCSHEQEGGRECESCGVIFARYERSIKRRQEQKAAQEAVANRRSSGFTMVVGALVLITLSAGATYYFFGSPKEPTVASLPKTESGSQEINTPASVQQRPATPPISIKSETQPAVVRSNTIEEARRATVSIETPWGTGSGFFVSDNYIVTNRHVIELDRAQLTKFRQEVEIRREFIRLERQKLKDLEARMRKMPKGPARSQLDIIISQREKELHRVMPQMEEAERRLRGMEQDIQPSDITIYLEDGSEHTASFLLTSDKHDLALLSLYIPEAHYLKRPPESYIIRQGDKVYTIGSPVGLRNTVTAGIFSGYRQRVDDGEVYLQTDAPINPGNSGGPLIDEKGYVRGVNTMILQNTEGIGFAIPIDKVFEEFGSSLY